MSIVSYTGDLLSEGMFEGRLIERLASWKADSQSANNAN